MSGQLYLLKWGQFSHDRDIILGRIRINHSWLGNTILTSGTHHSWLGHHTWSSQDKSFVTEATVIGRVSTNHTLMGIHTWSSEYNSLVTGRSNLVAFGQMTGHSYLIESRQITHDWYIILDRVSTNQSWLRNYCRSSQDRTRVTGQSYLVDWEKSSMTGQSYLVESGKIPHDWVIILGPTGTNH